MPTLSAQIGFAQDWVRNGVVGVGTGLQGGDPGTGSVGWARARTRIFSGLDLRPDESSADGMGFYGFVEIERRLTLGGEVRYQRWLTSTIVMHAAVLGTVYPESMLGLGTGARFGFPIGKALTLFLEPAIAAFPVGSDLPEKSVIFWGSLNGGVGVAL
ncbi:MAG TPA: hypothetical protein VKP30_23785 [Polyangiaceae bacterium]|nr:hypothetical protein [Polyangiaceae bacterium]